MVTSGEREGKSSRRGMGLRMHKIDKQERNIVQHGEYSHYFEIT